MSGGFFLFLIVLYLTKISGCYLRRAIDSRGALKEMRVLHGTKREKKKEKEKLPGWIL